MSIGGVMLPTKVNDITDNQDYILVHRQEIRMGDTIKTRNGKFCKSIAEPTPNDDTTYFVKVEMIDEPEYVNWDFTANDFTRYSRG